MRKQVEAKKHALNTFVINPLVHIISIKIAAKIASADGP
jgi:hypothetical protein